MKQEFLSVEDQVQSLKILHGDLFQQFSKVKVLVVGDVGLDGYTQGEVRRISPEAPVPVVEVVSEEHRVGLAANVAQNVVALGGQVSLVGLIGEDPSGDSLCSLLKEQGVDPSSLVRTSDRPTTQKLRIMAGQHHLLRVDYEKRSNISDSARALFTERIEKELKQVNVLVLQDYAKGIFDQALMSEVSEMAKSLGVPVYVDPHPLTSLAAYKGATFMTPNRDEAFKLANFTASAGETETDQVLTVGARIRETLELENFVITRGKSGMSLFQGDKVTHLPTYARQVFDVTGAGDTVIATLALSRAAGLSELESCILANLAAGIVVAKLGCATASPEEIIQFSKR